jgi:hypothetical protein
MFLFLSCIKEVVIYKKKEKQGPMRLSLYLDPEKLGALLSKTIHEAHARTCLLTKDQIHDLWAQGVDQHKLFLFKNMVGTERENTL